MVMVAFDIIGPDKDVRRLLSDWLCMELIAANVGQKT